MADRLIFSIMLLITFSSGLPEQIFKLPAIETVDASDNKIMSWPKKMDKLTKKAKVNTEGKYVLCVHVSSPPFLSLTSKLR